MGYEQAAMMAMGMINNQIEKNEQPRRQARLMDVEMKGQRMMSQYNRRQQELLWEYTGAVGQAEQMRKAGMNPAMMYGGGSPGGQTNAANGNVTGAVAADKHSSTTELMISAQQAAMTEAQIKNLEADTTKKTVEAEKTAGADTENVKAQTTNVIQQTENAKANEALTKMETSIQEINKWTNLVTQNDRIEKIEYETKRAKTELQRAQNETYISGETIRQQIKIINETAIAAVLRNKLTEKDIQKTDTEITAITNSIQQKWDELQNQDERTTTEQRRQMIEQDLRQQGIELQKIQTILGILGASAGRATMEEQEQGRNQRHFEDIEYREWRDRRNFDRQR